MNIALPLTTSGAFATRYGEATRFEVFNLDRDRRTIRRRLIVVPRASRPCQWPRLLRAAGVSEVLTGGLSPTARQAFAGERIHVTDGIAPAAPDALVAAWLSGRLTSTTPPVDPDLAACHHRHAPPGPA